MPPLPQATAAALARRAQELLRDAAQLTSGVDPNYIRDAQPDSLFEAVPLAAARQGCRRYADNPDEYTGLRQARVERACRPYLDAIEYGGQPTLTVPFRGGQCCDGVYSYIYRFRNPNTGQLQDSLQTFGPGLQLVGLSERSNQPAQPTKTGGPVFRDCATGAEQFIPLGTTFEGASLDQSIENLQRTDGGADNCGSPPPLIEPGPRPDPVEPTGPRPFNPSPGIDVDIDVTINPDLTFDIDFGVGPVTIDPFGDGGGGGGGGAGGPGSPGTPEDTGPGGEAEGEADDGQVLTGLRIDFVEPPIGGNEYAPGVYRAVCYIYMGTADGLDHDPAGAMLRSGQFVYAEKDFLTRWAVSANAGYNLRVTPYYRPAEAEE